MLVSMVDAQKMGTTGGNKRAWTTRDLAVIREHARLGAAAIAEMLGCTPRAVQNAAHRYRISLRRPGSRRGSVLGQPRGVSLRREIRDDLVTGRVDPEVLAERMRIDDEAEICPSCGSRPIRVRITGLCKVCHTGRLVEGHHESMDEICAQRELNRVKQQAKRMRDRDAAAGES